MNKKEYLDKESLYFYSIIIISIILLSGGLFYFFYDLSNTVNEYAEKTENSILEIQKETEEELKKEYEESSKKLEYEKSAKITGTTKGIISKKDFTPSKIETVSELEEHSSMESYPVMTPMPDGSILTTYNTTYSSNPTTKYKHKHIPEKYEVTIKNEEYNKTITVDNSSLYKMEIGTEVNLDVYTYEDGKISLRVHQDNEKK